MENRGKLVRDKIPEILTGESIPHSVRVMDETEYRAALVNKLLEEVSEVREAFQNGTRRDFIEELADVQELLFAIAQANEIHFFLEVEKMRKSKREKKGGFDKRLYMSTP